MRTLLVAGFAFIILSMSAFAADLPLKAPPGPAPVTYDWTGFYLGVNAGGAFGTRIDTSVVSSPVFPAGFVTPDDKPRGFFGGGQIGANYQLNYLVIGFEGTADWGSVAARTTTISPFIANFSTEAFGKFEALYTAAGRVGVAWRSLLIYGKGGGAWAEVHGNTSSFLGSVLTSQSVAFDHIDGGWLLGAGAEWMLSRQWSVKAEYNYVDLGPRLVYNLITYSTNPGTVGTYSPAFHTWKMNMMTTGLNYRF